MLIHNTRKKKRQEQRGNGSLIAHLLVVLLLITLGLPALPGVVGDGGMAPLADAAPGSIGARNLGGAGLA